MTPDTTALRAQAKRYALFVPEVPLDTFYALCDGYDEAQRLDAVVSQMGNAEMLWRDACAERDAARQALADLVADLRALCDAHIGAPCDCNAIAHGLRAVIDRHAPATPTTGEVRACNTCETPCRDCAEGDR